MMVGPHTSRGWALGLGSLAIFLSSVSAAIITIALQPMLSELHAGGPALIWISLAYLVPYASVLLVAGKLADTVGHRPVLLWSFAIYGIASVLAALAWNVPSAVALRALQGVGGAGLMISVAWVAVAWAGPRQGLAIGIWRALLLAGTVGGPPLGGALTAWLGWRSVFWITAPPALLGLALAGIYLREPGPAREKRRFDWLGAAATVLGLSALVAAMNFSGAVMGTAPSQSTSNSSAVSPQAVLVWALYALVILSALALWRSLERHPSPIVDIRLFAIPRFAFANAGTLLICVGMFSAMFFVPLFLQYQQHYSPLVAAAATLPITVMALVFGISGGWIADRLGLVIPSAVGFLLLALGFVLLAQLRPDTPYVFTALALVLSGVGMSLPLAPTAVAALTSVQEQSEGEAAGIFNLAHNLGRPLGLGVMGVILSVSSARSFSEIFWLSAITAALGFISALGLATPAAREEEGPGAPEMA